jgi:hypothetical protein
VRNSLSLFPSLLIAPQEGRVTFPVDKSERNKWGSALPSYPQEQVPNHEFSSLLHHENFMCRTPSLYSPGVCVPYSGVELTSLFGSHLKLCPTLAFIRD